MILDDKIIMFPPPPPYLQPPSSPTSSMQLQHPRPTLTSLPPHILLQIIHHTFPPISNSALLSHQQLYQDTKPEKQRKTLFWLSTSLRLVSRQLYTACMHVLRSTYLPSYQSLVRSPYTSDPFPLSLPTSSSATSSQQQQRQRQPSSPTIPQSIGPPAYSRSTTSLASLASQYHQPDQSPLLTIHRETPILDRFIALKVRQDVFADDTELHIDREDAFRDLFDVAQPRARLEDLVRVYGVREGLVSLPGWVPISARQPQAQGQGQGQPQGQPGQERIYTNPSQSSSSLGSLPGSPTTPTTTGASSQKPQYTYTLDHSVDPSLTPPSPTTTTTTTKATTTPTPKPRRSFFSFGRSSSSPQPPAPAHSYQTAQNQRTPTLNFTPQPTPQPQPPQINPIAFTSLSVSFSPRRVGLVLNRSRTIAEVPRLGVGRNREPLEALAKGLVEELRGVVAGY